MKKFFHHKTEDAPLDAALAAGAKRMYLPPAVARGDETYWSSLEQRIMARVVDPVFIASLEAQRWWTVLEGWSRAGLVAAGIVLAVSAALLQNQSQDDSNAAYEYVAASTAPDVLAPIVDQNESALNYVLAR
jgi:hypothetical protein